MSNPKTLKDKDLQNIRPVKGGVKIKSKQQRPPRQIQEKRRGVVQNVQPPQGVEIENLEPPTEDAVKLIGQIQVAKEKLLGSMKAFSRLLNDSKLLENKSEREKHEETLIINELVRSAQEVENLSPGDGIMSICIFSTRLSLSLRDAGNKLAYKIQEISDRVGRIEEKTGIKQEDPKAKEKQLLLEQAAKLGIKISIEGEDESI